MPHVDLFSALVGLMLAGEITILIWCFVRVWRWKRNVDRVVQIAEMVKSDYEYQVKRLTDTAMALAKLKVRVAGLDGQHD